MIEDDIPTEDKISEEELRKITDYIFSRSDIPEEYMKYQIYPNISEDPKIPTYSIYNLRGEVSQSKVNAYNKTINYIADIHENKKHGNGIFFYGEPNQKLGMSLLGTFIIRSAIEVGYTALYVPFSKFCSDLDYDGDFEDKYRYYDVDFLLIDCVSQKSSKTAKIIDGFADIILTRRSHKLPTIFASYITPDQLTARYSESLISYLEEFIDTCEIKVENGNQKVYDINVLIDLLHNQKKIKINYTKDEIDNLVKRFIK